MAVLLVMMSLASSLQAGMPAVLPSGWTADDAWTYGKAGTAGTSSNAWQIQALSFFTLCVLGGAFAIQRLWNHARRDVTVLPQISYSRAVSLVLLWGLFFVVVLTMISGARELMTPGAWRKQGWTYQLNSHSSESGPAEHGSQDARRASLAQFRTALWLYAASHEGRFPVPGDTGVDWKSAEIDGHPGLEFQLVPDQSAEEAGRLLAFEPTIEGDERLVLLTNGTIGTMSTNKIHETLRNHVRPSTPQSEKAQ